MVKLYNKGMNHSDAVACFIEKNNLPDDETTESTLRKDFYRSHKHYSIMPTRSYKHKN